MKQKDITFGDSMMSLSLPSQGDPGTGQSDEEHIPVHETSASENDFERGVQPVDSSCQETLPQRLQRRAVMTSNQIKKAPAKGVGGLSRTKSLFSMSSSGSSTSSETLEDLPGESDLASESTTSQGGQRFGQDVFTYTKGESGSPNFADTGLRKVMEPHLREGRAKREYRRQQSDPFKNIHASIAHSVGVPYTSLRKERPFLFDEHSYPLDDILARTLQVSDLTKLHETGSADVLEPLRDPEKRNAFHAAYDNFVTTFCIPLLHSLAIANNILHTSSSDQITYRYQAFPTIRVLQPGECGIGPRCDSSYGHSIGCLNFHIPLTPSVGSNALYAESHPGREDWHPLAAKSVGLGYLFDGARCLHFDILNSTDSTRVSLNFRVLLYRDFYGRMQHDGGLCPEELIEDRFSQSDPNYYDEALIDLGRSSLPGLEVVVKKYGSRLQPPSVLSGPPFVR